MFVLSKKWVLTALMLCLGALVVAYMQLPDGQFHIYFLDIGQGDAVLIQTPGNHQILVDGGPKNTVVEELAEVMSFFDRRIDLVVLSHPHADHVDGLVEVLKRYEVGAVLYTGVLYKNSAYAELLKEIREQEIVSFIAEESSDFSFGEVTLDVLYPFESVAGQSFENVNNSSVVLRVLYEGVVILLSGDLEIEGEEELLEAGVGLKADIFKAGHHGSRTSSTMAFLREVQPKIVVIQSGEDNSYGHPHAETMRNLHRIGVRQIYRNDLSGRVEITIPRPDRFGRLVNGVFRPGARIPY